MYTQVRERRSEARGEERAAAFRAGLEWLRDEAGSLSDDEIERRVRGISDELHLALEDAEVELSSHPVRDDHTT